MKFFSVYFHLAYIASCLCCSPGGSSGRRFHRDFRPGKRLPNQAIHEASPFNSGTCPDGKALRLEQILSTDILFEDSSYNSDSRMTTRNCGRSLKELSDRVKEYWFGQFKLFVKRGYIKTKSTRDSVKSLHLEGRAFDVTLLNSKDRRKAVPQHVLARTGEMAYYDAKFTFVEFHMEGFLHVSCSCKERQHSSRCFPGDSKVRLLNDEIKLMKDVVTGDKVLTLDNQGMPMYSEVIMMMHKEPNELIDDYILITNSNNESISLSSHHLIFVRSFGNAIFAKDARIGEWIFSYDKRNNGVKSSTVIGITRVSKRGMYAPLTEEGTIVVDNIYTSCYALFPSHTISHAMFIVWRNVYKLLKPLDTSIGNISDKGGDIHWYPNILRQTLNYFNIFDYLL